MSGRENKSEGNIGSKEEGGVVKGGEEVTSGQPLSLTTRLEIKTEERHSE